MQITDIGWQPFFQEALDQIAGAQLVPGRVAREDKAGYLVWTAAGEIDAEITGAFRHATRSRCDYPAVGDWLALRTVEGERRAIIRAVLPRRTRLVRKAPGARTREQVLAANMDTVFVVAGLDREFNPQRIERYLVVAAESGAEPVVLLNKADLCADTAACEREVRALDPDVAVLTLSALAGHGIESLGPWLSEGRTAVFVGSSGVGKSTLINALVGMERQLVGEVREYDDRGRHTTTWREMIRLPGGGVVIDTPGIREIQLWGEKDGSDGLDDAFEDVAALAAGCRFRDCSHRTEPGCAVLGALESGDLDESRYRGYLKLKAEMQSLALRQQEATRRADEKRFAVAKTRFLQNSQKRKRR